MEVVVPVKRFALGKQRLSEWVSPDDRYELCRMMAEWVLRELALTWVIDRIVVVTAEPALLRFVRGYSFDLVFEQAEQGGLSNAVSYALRQLASAAAKDACVVHADIPLFSSDELKQVIRSHRYGPEKKMTLVPDRAGQGTNVRLCRPVDAVPCMYGESSALLHEQAALLEGVSVEHFSSRTLSLDLDTYRDIAPILQTVQEWKPARIPPAVSLLSSLALRDNLLEHVNEYC